ncbi:MAG TPA: response regulator [Polyangiaceae bacterium]|nr:response regulator [Polyangiaceae bacterium]
MLIVEDEETLGGTLRDLLEVEGYEVELATNGADALGRIARGRPDVVLLDFMLPIADGAEVLRRLAAEGVAGARVIVMTSAARESLGDAKYDHFLAKPFRLDAVLRLIAGGGA